MSQKTRKLTTMGILMALIIVLGMLGNFVKIGPFPISLALCPIIIGAALYGPAAGALLGAVLGIVTIITGILGWDGGTVMLLMSSHPFWCVFVCILKTTAAGYLAGLVYKAVTSEKETKLGVVLAGIVCPVVNTGIFILSMILFWKDTLASWAGGKNIILFAITGIAGINFLIELAINMILASAITLIIKSRK